MKTYNNIIAILTSFLMTSISVAQQSEVVSNSSKTSPTLLLKETQGNDFARLWFQTNTTDKWGLNAKPTDGQFDNDGVLSSPIVFAYDGVQRLGLSSTGQLRINKAYVLPDSDGMSGQVLSTNGSGVVSWASGGSGGSSNLIQDTDGNSFIKVEDANEIIAEIDGEDLFKFKLNANGSSNFEFFDDDDNLFLGHGCGTVNNGTWNTGVGQSALLRNTTGSQNTGIGYYALAENTTGSFNTAVGRHAMKDATTGSQNTAYGNSALYNF